MTLGTIFRSVLGPSTSTFLNSPAAGHSHKLLSDRNSDYYYYGSQKHHKRKSKSDKKHAVLSALALLAFLFFLNILQNCIREQNSNRGMGMMFTPTGPTAPNGHQAKNWNQDFKLPEKPSRKKRNAESLPKNKTKFERKSRMLLNVREISSGGRWRQVKFIRNFGSVSNWTEELSQMSEKDLEEQKLKTLNFPLYWKNSRFASTGLRFNASPEAAQGIVNKTVAQNLRNFKKREKTSTITEIENKPLAAAHNTWNYKKPEKFHTNSYFPDIRSSTNRYRERTQNATWETKTNEIVNAHLTYFIKNTPTPANSAESYVATTPRNKKSDYSAALPENYDRYSEHTQEAIQMSQTSAFDLDPNIFYTFSVHNYHNHRPDSYRENQTVDKVTSESTTPGSDRNRNKIMIASTQQSLFHSAKTSPSYLKSPHYKFRNPSGHVHHTVRNRYPMDSKYRYSPYLKGGVYETAHFHDDFNLPIVLAKYEVQNEEPGFDAVKFLWATVSSFTKPLALLVPSFAKNNIKEAQCYDLMVCEARRLSKFMGPTAEALVTSAGTLLTLAATEETRQTVVNAINSGRENTCQQQIRDCEKRSGGKSALTIIAQIME